MTFLEGIFRRRTVGFATIAAVFACNAASAPPGEEPSVSVEPTEPAADFTAPRGEVALVVRSAWETDRDRDAIIHRSIFVEAQIANGTGALPLTVSHDRFTLRTAGDAEVKVAKSTCPDAVELGPDDRLTCTMQFIVARGVKPLEVSFAGEQQGESRRATASASRAFRACRVCNELCVDVQTDAEHCGACGNACSSLLAACMSPEAEGKAPVSCVHATRFTWAESAPPAPASTCATECVARGFEGCSTRRASVPCSAAPVLREDTREYVLDCDCYRAPVRGARQERAGEDEISRGGDVAP